MDKWKWMKEEQKRIRAEHFDRHMIEIRSPQETKIRTEDGTYRLFCSNSYLDFCNEERVKQAFYQAAETYGTGSGGSRLTTGTTVFHDTLEKEIARFKKRASALVFNTGYMANVGILQAVAKKGDVIFSDEKNHASIIDGCRLSGAKTVVYQHNDMQDLEQKVREAEGEFPGHGVIVSDGVFSMDGDIVNLPELVRIADTYGCLSMIDEAHATGVIGKTGRGTEEYYGLEGSVDILMGTLSKSIGSEGGYAAGSELLREYLLNHARSFIFSTSLPAPVMAAASEAFRILEEDSDRVRALQTNIVYANEIFREFGMKVHSETAIFPVLIGEEAESVRMMEALKAEGFYVGAIRYPSVPKGAARLRVTLMASHTKDEIRELIEAIAQISRKR